MLREAFWPNKKELNERFGVLHTSNDELHVLCKPCGILMLVKSGELQWPGNGLWWWRKGVHTELLWRNFSQNENLEG